MKVHKKILKAFGALLIAALLFAGVALNFTPVSAAAGDINITKPASPVTVRDGGELTVEFEVDSTGKPGVGNYSIALFRENTFTLDHKVPAEYSGAATQSFSRTSTASGPRPLPEGIYDLIVKVEFADESTFEEKLENYVIVDNTKPDLESVSPTEGAVALAADETFVLMVDANDASDNLYELEIDHSMENNLNTPEFSVYASETDPYGGDGELFDDAGVGVTYDAAQQKWTIDFGSTITGLFLDNGGITFYLVLKDEAGNQWGSMYDVTPENTFAYTITQDTDLPDLESVSPAAGTVYLAGGDSFVLTVDASDASDNLYELEIDHSMENNLNTPEFSVYASETDPYGGDGEQFDDAGVEVTYDAAQQKWTIDFGSTITGLFLDNGGITFYLVLKDEVGNQWGSMYDVTPENTFAYSFEEANDGDIITLDGDVDGNITILTSRLTINLNGATIGPGSPAFTVIGNYTTINGPGTLDGSGSTAHAIVVEDGVIDFTLDTVEIKGWADGLHFNGVITDTVIVDNYIHDNTGDGVYFGAQPVDQTGVSFYIQGNMFKDNGGVGVNNAGTTDDVNAEYNSWGDYAGATPPDGDGRTNADTEPFTHVEVFIESTNPDVDNWSRQVFLGETITYEVTADLREVMGADFWLEFPTNLSVESTTLGEVFDVETLTVDGNRIRFEGYQSDTLNPAAAVSGEGLLLYTVTFNADTLGKGLSLNFDETTDLFSMSPGYGPSLHIYADALNGATLDVIDRPVLTITSGLDTDLIAGISRQIDSTIVNPATGGDWSESVAAPIEPDTVGWIRISDVKIEDIAEMQFLWQVDGLWHDFTDQNAPGYPALQEVGDDVIARFCNWEFGCEIPNDWTDSDSYRITFKEPGTHTITVEIYDMMDQPAAYGDGILLTSYGPVTIEVLGDFESMGTISMQGRTDRSGVPVTLLSDLYDPINVWSMSMISNNVRFTTNGGLFTFTTLQPRYLNVTEGLGKTLYITGPVTFTSLELKGGNAVWENHASSNNKIDIYDASEVGSKYGSTGDLDADVNFDGKVNIQDLALVGGNFDLQSTDPLEANYAYGTWTP